MNIEVGRLLLVEDSENDIEMTLAALEANKLANRIDVARDGEEALDYIFRRNSFAGRDKAAPVVILLDIKLPKLSGIQVLREIRAHPETNRVPVVMLTSSRQEPDLHECYAMGCNAYVVKPVSFQEFSEALKVVGCF